MLIQNEKKRLSSAPNQEDFFAAPKDFRPHFLHGVQQNREGIKEHTEKNLIPKAEAGINIEPNWRRWDDPTLFADDDPYWKDCSETLAFLKENNMFAWIYDEPGYPSGSLGIITLKGNEHLVQKGVQIVFKDLENEAAALSVEGEFLAAFALKTEQGNIVVKKQLEKPEFKADGSWRLCAFSVVPLLEATIPHVRRRGRLPDETISRELLYGYPNFLDKKATELFIKAGYEPYAKRFGEYMGKELRAFFTDEPTIPFRHFFGPDYPAAVPWSNDFADIYSAEYNEDIISLLPELFFTMKNSDIIRCKFYELVSKLFCENFLKVMSEWCSDHEMYFTGHLLHEEQLATQILCSGNVLRSAKNMSMPGTDNLSMGYPGRGVGARMSVMGTSSQNGATTAKLISSGAHLAGNARTASETHGWSCPEQNTSYASYIATSNWQYVLGINSLPYYTMDWKNSTNEQKSAYVKYASRMSYVTSGGKHIAPVAVLYPINTIAAYLTPLDEKLPSIAGLGPLEREYWYYNYNAHMNRLQNYYDDTCTHLLSNQTDFDYVEDGDIANAIIEDGKIKIANEEYQTVLLPHCEYLTAPCARALIEFMDKGGKLAAAGAMPRVIIDENNSCLLDALCKHQNMNFFESAKAACDFVANNTMHTTLSRGFKDIYVLHIQKENNDIFFVTNNSLYDWEGEYIFPVYDKQPQLWNAFDGKIYNLPYEQTVNGCKIKAKLCGYQAHLIVFGNNSVDIFIDITKDFSLPKAEKIEDISCYAEQLSKKQYFKETEPKCDFVADAIFTLHAPDNGLYITDKAVGMGEVSVAPGYRSGEVLEGLTFECELEANGIYKFTAEISETNINYWGIMPRHYDKDGKELIEKGMAGNWRNEFSLTLEHEPCEFSIWFNVPEQAVKTTILVSPLSKRTFCDSAELKVSNARLYKAKDASMKKEYIIEKGKVCSL